MNADDVFRYGHLTVLGAVEGFPPSSGRRPVSAGSGRRRTSSPTSRRTSWRPGTRSPASWVKNRQKRSV